MKKTKVYGTMEFPPRVIHKALNIWMEHTELDEESFHALLSVTRGRETWDYDDTEQFFAGCDGERPDRVYMDVGVPKSNFRFDSQKSCETTLAVALHERAHIESVFAPLEEYSQAHPEELLPKLLPTKESGKPIVFVGHGRSQLWRGTQGTSPRQAQIPG